MARNAPSLTLWRAIVDILRRAPSSLYVGDETIDKTPARPRARGENHATDEIARWRAAPIVHDRWEGARMHRWAPPEA